MSTLLDHYNNLASNSPNVRIAAAEALLNDLAEANRPADWDYALGRLVRGLSSSRDSVRLGFSVALTELLRIRASKISIPYYLDLCTKKFEVTKSASGSEERGLLFGRLFAYEALSRSPIMEKCDNENLKLVFSALIDLSLQKLWLREPPFAVICYLVQTIDIERYKNAIKSLFEEVCEKGLSQTSEGICLALSIPRESRAYFNDMSTWNYGDPMHPENLEKLVHVIREMQVHSSDVSKNRPYVHKVWSYILNELIKTQRDTSSDDAEPPKKKKRKGSSKKSQSGSDEKSSNSDAETISLESFWNLAVDRDLFGPDTSIERKMWGFEIFIVWVENLELSNVTCLFSPNFLRSLTTHSAQKNSNLKRVTQHCHAKILMLPQKRPDEVVSIVLQFLKYSPNFDKISKSETLGVLLANIKTESAVSNLIEKLLDYIRTTSPSELVRKQWIFDNVAYLLRCYRHSTSSANLSSWIASIFKTLIPMAYFINPAVRDIEDQDKLSTVTQSKIMSILSLTLDSAPKGVAADPQTSWPYIVFQLILNYKDINPSLEPRVEFDEETTKAKSKAEHTLNKIHSTRNSSRHVDSCELQAFELLFAMVLLQVYASVPEAIGMLDELQTCYQNFDGKHIANPSAEDPNLEDASNSSVILTEILISLLSKESTVLRKLSEEVWRTLCRDLSQDSANLLCDILVAGEGAQGQRDLFDVGDDDDGAEDEFEDDEELDEEQDDAAEGDDRDGSDNEDEEFGSDYEMDEEARRRLAGTLGVPAGGNEVDFDDSDSESESSMDDEQMSKLDVHLATIFSERRKIQIKAKEKREENKTAKQNIVRLKSRILDLIEIYFTENSDNINGLKFLLPLLQCIKQTKEGRLAERARDIIRTKLCRRTEYEISQAEDVPKYLAIIKDIHLIASESDSKLLSLACNQCSTFVAKLILRFDPSLISSVFSLYGATLESWFLEANSKVMSTLFVDLINFLNSIRGSDSSTQE